MTQRGVRLIGAVIGALAVFVTPGAPRAETRVGGPIQGETRWTKQGSPYVAYEDVVVEAGAHLILEPGTVVRFKANINDQQGFNKFDLEILVKGRLTARGAERDTVVFTSDSGDPTWFDWQGIVLDGDAAVVDLAAVRIGFCNVGVRAQKGTVTLRDVTVRDISQAGVHLNFARGTFNNVLATSVGNSGGTGIGIWLDQASTADIEGCFMVGVQNGIQYSRRSAGTLTNTVITLCTGTGLRMQNSDPQVHGCTITGNEFGIICGGGARPVITGNNIFDNGGSDLQLYLYEKEVVQVDVSGNWWGTTELAAIDDRVRDALDDPKEKGFAVIEPILTEAVTVDKSEKP